MLFSHLLLLAVQLAAPDRRLPLYRDAGEVAYLEMQTLDRSGTDAIFWIAHEYAKPRAKGVKKVREQWYVDCARRTFSIYGLVSYDRTGKIVLVQPIPSVQRRPAAIVAGSRMERVYRAVCA
jgi:hypothetical protein